MGPDGSAYNLNPRLEPIELCSLKTPPLPEGIQRPIRIDEMIDIAERLALPGLQFQRIDLHEDSGRVIFGAIAFTPAAGLMTDFEPLDLNDYLGTLFVRGT